MKKKYIISAAVALALVLGGTSVLANLNLVEAANRDGSGVRKLDGTGGGGGRKSGGGRTSGGSRQDGTGPRSKTGTCVRR